MNHRQCTHCFEIKQESEFPIEKRRPDYRRSNCKKCHSAEQQGNFFRKMLEKKPNQYVTCDECDKTMSIFTAKRPAQINKCKYCESEQLYLGTGEKYENQLYY